MIKLYDILVVMIKVYGVLELLGNTQCYSCITTHVLTFNWFSYLHEIFHEIFHAKN